MKKLLYILPFILISCDPATDYYKEGERIHFKNFNDGCNCVIESLSDQDPKASIICRDSSGRVERIEYVRIHLIEKCEEEKIKIEL